MSKRKTILSRAAEAMGITTPEPVVVTPSDPDLSTRGGHHFWPKDQPLPTNYVKVRRNTLPCPKCRRVLMDSGSQAVACRSSGALIAHFLCRSCGHRWSLPVKEV